MFKSLLYFPNITSSPLDFDRALKKARSGELQELGQYAIAWEREEQIAFLRDPLGCNKLFYGYNSEGDLIAANRINDALDAGVNLDDLASCPPGHMVFFENGAFSIVGGSDLSTYTENPEFNIRYFQKSLRERLDEAFHSLRAQFGDHCAYICLSGGLDSSIVLKLATKYFRQVVAVSFSYLSDSDLEQWHPEKSTRDFQSRSADFRAAESVAEAIGVPLLPVFRKHIDVEAVVPETIRLCQDWRDFNVHCAVVNRFLAEDIREHAANTKAVVMTGDLMNEFVCDYKEEVFEGTVYYPQPRVGIGKRRRFFIRGLDAGDREIGVFNAYGLTLIQPFSFTPDIYMGVPATFLEEQDAKRTLNGHLIDDGLLSHVSAVKQRAQVGGDDGGTLGIFHHLGLRQENLLQIWEDELPIKNQGSSPEKIIQFGRYRTAPQEASV